VDRMIQLERVTLCWEDL